MKLFIDGLVKKDGYFEMPFDAYGFLGEDLEKLVIIGDNLEANFEVAITSEEKSEDSKIVIYQTPNNFLYNTLGYIAKVSCLELSLGIHTFFNLVDLIHLEQIV